MIFAPIGAAVLWGTHLALAVEARRIRVGLKVLLTSGDAGALRSNELGAGLDILEKPYSHDLLALRLRRAIGGWSGA